MNNNESDNGSSIGPWKEYARAVTGKLTELTAEVTKLRDEITGLRTDFSYMKGKVVVWGAVAGLVAGALLSFLLKVK